MTFITDDGCMLIEPFLIRTHVLCPRVNKEPKVSKVFLVDCLQTGGIKLLDENVHWFWLSLLELSKICPNALILYFDVWLPVQNA